MPDRKDVLSHEEEALSLKDLRLKLDLTYHQLAKMAKVSTPTIRRGVQRLRVQDRNQYKMDQLAIRLTRLLREKETEPRELKMG